jgi:hypothetical protein
MFKKLHSNRDPANTVFTEIRKEFAVYFSKAGNGLKKILQQYPKQIYAGMLILMLTSAVISFTIGKNEPAKSQLLKTSTKRMKPVRDGFGGILETGKALRQTLALKDEIEVMLSKDTLTSTDSLRLEKALDELQIINKSLEK